MRHGCSFVESLVRAGRRWHAAALAPIVVAGAFLAASAAQADPPPQRPDDPVYTKYVGLIASYQKRAAADETMYRSTFVGHIDDEFGKPVPDKTILDTLQSVETELNASLASLEQVHKKYAADSTTTLASDLSDADTAMQRAIEQSLKARFDLMGWRVALIQTKRHKDSDALSAAWDNGRAALSKQFPQGGPALDAAIANLKAGLAAKEQQQVVQAAQDYEAVEKQTLADITALAGDTWQLSDFNTRVQRRLSAKAFRVAVYSNFCYGLGKRDQKLLGDLFGKIPPDLQSAVDLAITFPGSHDRLIIMRVFDAPKGWSGPPGPDAGLWKMDKILEDHPVESMRKNDNTLPPVKTNGKPLEEISQILSARLQRFYILQGQQAALYDDIASLTNKASEEGLIVLPDIGGLAAEFDAAMDKARKYNELQSEIANAKERLDTATAAVEKAQKALDAASAGIVVAKGPTGYRIVPAGTKGAQTTTAVRKIINEKISNNKLNNVPTTGLESDLADFQALIDAALKKPRDALASAKTDQATARTKLQAAYAAASGAKPDAYLSAYSAAKTRYDNAIRTLPENERAGLAALPDKADDYIPKTGNAAIKALSDRIEQIRNRGKNARLALQGKLGDLQRDQDELRDLAQVIANNRAAGIGEAENTLAALGAEKFDSDLTRQLEALKAGLEAAKEILDKGSENVERLGKIKGWLTKAEDGNAIIENVSTHAKTMAKAFKMVGNAVEAAAAASKLADQLQSKDPTARIEAIALALTWTGKIAGRVPVIGDTLGRFLDFYAKGASACADASAKIQQKIIETDVNSLLKTPPERHLYTEAEVQDMVSRQNADTDRVTRMLQVRRLLFLLHANSAGEAVDVRRPS